MVADAPLLNLRRRQGAGEQPGEPFVPAPSVRHRMRQAVLAVGARRTSGEHVTQLPQQRGEGERLGVVDPELLGAIHQPVLDARYADAEAAHDVLDRHALLEPFQRCALGLPDLRARRHDARPQGAARQHDVAVDARHQRLGRDHLIGRDLAPDTLDRGIHQSLVAFQRSGEFSHTVVGRPHHHGIILPGGVVGTPVLAPTARVAPVLVARVQGSVTAVLSRIFWWVQNQTLPLA